MIIGLQLYDADEATERRQRLAVEALLALGGVQVVNLQFRQGPPRVHPALETVPVLEASSVTLTRAAVRRKPATREVFDVLAQLARSRNLEYFAFLNSDILVSAGVPALVAATRRQTYAISRGDVDDAAAPVEPCMLTAGQDMFIVAESWWSRHARRFRPYILGEMAWDVVYTATMLCHSNGLLLNRDPLVLHERHAAIWHAPTPAARYNGMLAALDARYFSIWCTYWTALEALRAAGGSRDDENRLRERMFVWRPSGLEALKQVGRTAKARLHFLRLQRQWSPAPSAFQG